MYEVKFKLRKRGFMTQEKLIKLLEKQSNEWLQGFYANDNAYNPFSFFSEYTKHLDFSNGNQSILRKFYQNECTF